MVEDLIELAIDVAGSGNGKRGGCILPIIGIIILIGVGVWFYYGGYDV